MAIGALQTPIGCVRWATIAPGICAVALAADDKRAFRAQLRKTYPEAETNAGQAHSSRLAEWLRCYFAGERVRDCVAPLVLAGTPFQLAVWHAMRQISYGETRSYCWLAQASGRPRAARAVGGACHRNPLPLLIPCHRVVGANGRLTGFGAGLPVKQFLLDLEQKCAGKTSVK